MQLYSLTKDDLIRLCKSLPAPIGDESLARDYGDQHNTDWRWKDGVFKTMTEDVLWRFYLKNRRTE